MGYFVKRTWAEIDLDALHNNFINIRKKTNKDSMIMCVVKADAYGHGAGHIASELQKYGADWFAVSNIEEAIQLREYGIDRPILVLGYTPIDMTEKLFNFNISQSIFSYEYALEMMETCKQKKIKIKSHIKLDTGMSRIGFLCHSNSQIISSTKLIEELYKSEYLDIEGIFTHFAVSDSGEEGKTFTEFQFNNFKRTIECLKEKDVKIPIKHCCNSGAIIDYPRMHLDMVRAGIILYGLLPSKKLINEFNISPVMQLKTVISQIKKIIKGTSISYGRIFTAEKDMIIATVPIGYADGYFRELSGKSDMLVNGKRAPVLGRICMDQLMIDVTDIDGVYEGMEVTVFGSQNSNQIPVDEIAENSNTVNYEIVCLIGKRVSRIYYKKGEIVGQLSYI